MILAHSLSTDFFGVDELADYYPDFEGFYVWPATERALRRLRRTDHLAGQNSVAELACYWNPSTRRVTLCTEQEKAQERHAPRPEAWGRA